MALLNIRIKGTRREDWRIYGEKVI